MSKRVDHGLAEPKKKRARPASTSRPVHPEQIAAERGRAARTAPLVDAGPDTPEGTPKKARRRSVKK